MSTYVDLRRITPRVVIAIVVVAALPPSVRAQSGRFFVGVGATHVVDQAPRLVLGAIEEGTSSGAITVDGGVFLTSRVGVGVELLMPFATRTSTSGHFGTASKSEREFLVTGICRVTAFRARHASAEVLGGLSAIRATYESETNALQPVARSSERRSAATFLAGADVMFLPASHIGIGPIVRVHWLRADRRARRFLVNPAAPRSRADDPVRRRRSRPGLLVAGSAAIRALPIVR